MNILVVDDDADQLDLRRMLLERFGFRVTSAASADTALERVTSAVPDCVVMDLCLPAREDGLRLLRALKEQHPEVRVVVVSGWQVPSEAVREVSLADRWLVKPVPVPLLVGVLRGEPGAEHAAARPACN